MVPPPRPGQTVFIGRAASAQFSGQAGFNFRIIRVDDQPTYDGWAWLDGYQLNRTGDATERRSIFVLVAGLQPGEVQPAGEGRRRKPRPQPR
jgi:hypothetical protein